MASSCLTKLRASHTPLTGRLFVSFRRPAAVVYPSSSPSRFISTHEYYKTSYFRLDNRDQCKCSLKATSKCSPQVLDLVKNAFCPELSAIRNLARLLNLMDEHIGVEYKAPTPSRWDVMEDDKALYLVRDMSQLPQKDVEKVNYDLLFSGLTNIFGCVRVNRLHRLLKIIVGVEGPDPGAAYEGYIIRIYLPDTMKRLWDIKMDVRKEVLKIIIPKKNKGKPIRRITIDLNFFWPEMYNPVQINI